MRRRICATGPSGRRSVVLPMLVLVPALALSGCASRQEAQSAPRAHASHAGGPDPRITMAHAGHPALADTSKVVIEDDGMPAQLPPPSRRHPMPDDPAEPWSPNYGTLAPRKAAGTDGLLPAVNSRASTANATPPVPSPALGPWRVTSARD